VEVCQGWVTGPGHHGEGPEQFVWRGRLWKVRAVLAHWVETGPWWHSPSARAVIGSDEPTTADRAGDLLVEHELWRVEAGRGGDSSGIFDLSFSWDSGRWQLVACAD